MLGLFHAGQAEEPETSVLEDAAGVGRAIGEVRPVGGFGQMPDGRHCFHAGEKYHFGCAREYLATEFGYEMLRRLPTANLKHATDSGYFVDLPSGARALGVEFSNCRVHAITSTAAMTARASAPVSSMAACAAAAARSIGDNPL